MSDRKNESEDIETAQKSQKKNRSCREWPRNQWSGRKPTRRSSRNGKWRRFKRTCL